MSTSKLAACAAAFALLPGCSNSDQDVAGAAVAVAAAVKAQDPAPAAVLPSFDCAKAGSEVETMVCGDPVLAQFDNELARLFTLAGKEPNLSLQAANELTTVQRGWIKGRNDCWKADDKRQCALASYAMRIHELRQGYANARVADPASVSVGPVVFKCEGIDAPLGVTFIAIEPGYAFLQNRDKAITFTAVVDAPDARYIGKGLDGEYVFVSSGKDALFTAPGASQATCPMDEIG